MELSLPKYLAELDDPNVPFVLLEDNDTLTYIAQSGLIGPDGIDSDGRALFSASASTLHPQPRGRVDCCRSQWQGNADVRVTKRLTLHRGTYLIDVDYSD